MSDWVERYKDWINRPKVPRTAVIDLAEHDVDHLMNSLVHGGPDYCVQMNLLSKWTASKFRDRFYGMTIKVKNRKLNRANRKANSKLQLHLL